MPDLDPAVVGLLIFAGVLLAGCCAAGLGAFLSDYFRIRRERRDVERCIGAARKEAGAEEG